jgi:RNA polymerase sigma factor (sigma-70 family)
MATTPIRGLLHYLREALVPHQGPGPTDGQLLTSFVEQGDEAAMTALVQRHGAMVWGVCRRVLHDLHDAEDAFQATFLVLVRRAASIASRELLANWLYGVARQTARKARTMAAKRRSREKQVPELPEPEARPPAPPDNVEALLDGELSRLPNRYRTVVVLCDLEGCTRREAALQLGVPEGTVAARLTRARALLAKRLLRRGFLLSNSAVAAVFPDAASAGVPAAVVSSTVRAATWLAADQVAEGALSPTVTALMQGALKAMLLNKLWAVTVVLLLGTVVVLVGGLLAQLTAAHQGQAEKPSARADKDDADARKKAAEAIAQERKHLAGTWRLVGVERDGKKAPQKDVDEIAHHKIVHVAQDLGVRTPNTAGVTFVVVIDAAGKWKEQTHGGKLKMPRMEGDKVVYDDTVVFAEGTSTIDPAGKPRTMDQVVTRRVGGKGYTRRGIYEFVNRDRLRVCYGEPDKGRPAGFAGHMLWVFERVKADRPKEKARGEEKP